MLYMIIGRDVRNSLEDVRNSLERRLAVRPTHLERLQELQAQGRLVLAGPLPALDCLDPGPEGFLGSLIVAEFDSLSDARDWAEADPYMTQGVFAEVEVLPFKKVLPA